MRWLVDPMDLKIIIHLKQNLILCTFSNLRQTNFTYSMTFILKAYKKSFSLIKLYHRIKPQDLFLLNYNCCSISCMKYLILSGRSPILPALNFNFDSIVYYFESFYLLEKYEIAL